MTATKRDPSEEKDLPDAEFRTNGYTEVTTYLSKAIATLGDPVERSKEVERSKVSREK